MMFTSGTQARDGRTVNHDPYPYRSKWDRTRSRSDKGRLAVAQPVYDPRSEFAVLDNPILAKYRETDERTRWHMRQGSWVSWPAPPYPEGAEQHARRVLSKLKSLAGEDD